MPTPSKIDELTPQERDEFDAELVRRNFKNYDGIFEWLNSRGFEVSRTSAWRYGNALKKSLQQIKNATEIAKTIAENTRDDFDYRSAATIAMLQMQVFEITLKLKELSENEDDNENEGENKSKAGQRAKIIQSLSKSIADLSKSSLNQKRWESNIRKQEREKMANETREVLKQNGISQEVEDKIYELLTGRAD